MARRQGGDLMARQSDALAWRSDLRPRLEDLACPVLALWGAEDRFVSAAEGLALATALPRARFVRIEACGHFPTLEAPAEAAAAIRHWLADYGLA
jgi:pimeloyl-ACP methyl ester carboxylesterase